MKDFGKAVRGRLSEAGCVFLRRGKGDHDIWATPEGTPIVVPVKDQVPPYGERHLEGRWTAEGVLTPRAFRVGSGEGIERLAEAQ